MNDLDSRLSAALGSGAPPARDVMFRIEVLRCLERTRFRRRVALTVAVALAAAVLATVNASGIEAWVTEDVRRFWLLSLGAAVAILAPAGARLAANPGVRTLVNACGRWLSGHGQNA